MYSPGFTAEASLYKTSRNYCTGRKMVNPPAQTASAIYSAMETGETIIIEDTAPIEAPLWFQLWGLPQRFPPKEPLEPKGPKGGGGGGGSGDPPPKPPTETICECGVSGCGEYSGDPCRWEPSPYSGERQCKGSCRRSDGKSCGPCEEHEVPAAPKARRILRHSGSRQL